jgi:biopolymer transport protein ExbB
MPGTCLISWQTDGCQWSLGYLWGRWDWIERSVLVTLALMFAYTVFIVIRFFCRYYLGRRTLQDFKPDHYPDVRRTDLKLVADLTPGIEMLKGIASAAPFLGLAGTCYAFLAGFRNISGSRASGLAYLVGVIVHAPLATVAGIVVAIPAAFSYNALRTRVEALSRRALRSWNPPENDLRSPHFAQTLSLKKPFSALPPYALLAAPFLGLVITVFIAFKPYPATAGLRVRVLPPGPPDGPAAQVVIGVMADASGSAVIRVNSKRILSDKLEDVVAPELASSPEPQVYVEAEYAVAWRDVADVIGRMESLHYQVILQTAVPHHEAEHQPGRQ